MGYVSVPLSDYIFNPQMCYLLNLIVQINSINVLQMRLLGECRGSIDAVKKMGFELKEEDDTVSGLADPSSSESQTSGNTTEQLTLKDFNSVSMGVTYGWFHCNFSYFTIQA